MNTKIREWMPVQAKECDEHLKKKYGRSLDEMFTPDKYQLMHIEMFDHGIIHAESMGGDMDLLLNQRAVIGCFPWRFVAGESCISRIVAFVDDDRHAALMAKKAKAELTKYGDVAGSRNAWLHAEARKQKCGTLPAGGARGARHLACRRPRPDRFIQTDN
jgi:hypothetical protein